MYRQSMTDSTSSDTIAKRLMAKLTGFESLMVSHADELEIVLNNDVNIEM